MKVGIWLNEDYRPEEGGGHSYYDKLIKAIDKFEFDNRLEIVFIAAGQQYNFRKKTVIIGPLSFIQSTSKKLGKLILSTKLKYKILHTAFKSKYKKLQEARVDLIYYPIQAQQAIPDFPFIATNWDLGHLSTYPFPEFTNAGEFEERERWYKQQLPQALVIFAESEAGKKELVQYLQIAPHRIKVVPLFSGNIDVADDATLQTILNKFKLTTGRYFFYPAQFWAHKNHFCLVTAFKDIAARHPDLRLVFTGSDKGNLSYIKAMVAEMGLTDKVSFLGFVDSNELYTLYKNATALVMPSWLGPTNMPLLEAWELNCPIICSDIEGHREMLKDIALYFDPANPAALATQLQNMLDEHQRKPLLEKANQQLPYSAFKVETSVLKMQQHLIDLIPIKKTWQ